MPSATLTSLHPTLKSALPSLVKRLEAALGANLSSVVVYGSAARGDWDPASSDINLMIILEVSTPEAHEVLARELFRDGLKITPFVLGHRGLERSVRAFATKFISIRRSSVLLHGTDLLTTIPKDEALLRQLSEQALRNHRLRAVQAYMRSGGHGEGYARWLSDIAGRLISELSTAARLCGVTVEGPLASRLAALSDCFGIDRADLEALLAAKHQRPTLATPAEVTAWHGRLYRLLDTVLLRWEDKWPLQ